MTAQFIVPTNDMTYQTPGMINCYPNDFSFKEKYRKPLSIVKTYFISSYKFIRKNPFEYNFMNFTVETFKKIDIRNGEIYEEYIEVHPTYGNFRYQRSSDFYFSFDLDGKSYTERHFKEEPGGILYFQNKKDLTKFKLLL